MSDIVNPTTAHTPSIQPGTTPTVISTPPAMPNDGGGIATRPEPQDTVNLGGQTQAFAATYSSSQSTIMMAQNSNSNAMLGLGEAGTSGSNVLDQQTMEFMLAMLILAYLVGGPEMMQQMLDLMGGNSQNNGSSDQTLAASSSSSAGMIYMQSSTQSLSMTAASSSHTDVMA